MKNSEQASESQVGAGEMLREAREKAGLGIAEIAARLHINQAYLEAIETQQYAKIASPTFVKGYLRAYAKAVELDPDAVVKAYVRVSDPLPEWRAHAGIQLETPDTRRQMIWIAVSGVALIVLLVGLFWWLGRDATPRGAVSENEILERVAPVAQPAVLQAALETTNVAMSDQPEVDLPPKAATTAAPQQTAEPEAEGPETFPTESDSTQASPPSQHENHAVPQEPSTPAPASVANGPDAIKLSLKADSWIDIRDANDQKLLHGLYRTGATRELKGTAPFQVFLGNAPAVQVEFNGKPFDASKFVKDNKTARFALIRP